MDIRHKPWVSLNVQGHNHFLKLLFMKKSLLNLGTVLSKTQQKKIQGGIGNSEICGCSSNYVLEGNSFECSYEPKGGFPGSRCYGSVQNGLCCPY